MRFILRALGISVAAFFIVVFTTFTFVFIKKVWFGGGGKHAAAGKSHVMILEVSGIMMSATRELRELDEALDNPHTKAIVVRVNSPGGLVAPSQELYEALKRADQKVPVVISMGSLAASGGYYASLGGRKIYANAGTLTASIGVVMEFMNLQKLYEWAKIERYAMTAGKLKAAGSEFRPMTAEERELFTGMLSDIHAQFKAAVKERRKLSDEEIEKWCDGRVMTGQQAKAAKLVDALGPLEDAVRDAKKLAGIPESAEVIYPESREGLLKRVLFGEDNDTQNRLGDAVRAVAGAVAAPPAIAPGWKVMLLSPVR